MDVSGDAIAGLLGVLVGGVITTGGTVWLERRRTSEREEERITQARVAARLLANELEATLGSLKVSIDHGKWVDDPDRILQTDTWTDRRAAVAIEDFGSSWQPVEDAYGVVTGLRQMETARGTRMGAPFPPALAQLLAPRIRIVEVARDELRNYASVPPFEEERYVKAAAEIVAQAESGGWQRET